MERPVDRQCKKCGEIKPLEAFTKDAKYRWGYRYVCTSCKNAGDRRKTGTIAHHDTKETRNVLSLGAGVQSSTVLLMSEHGELPPLDLAIFADTHWEPKAVYKHLEWLESHCSTEIRRVSAGDIRKDALDEDRQFVSMPLFTGNGGMSRRQCTSEYKIKPIRKELSLWVERRHRSVKIIQWIGISLDESHRMTDPKVAWIDNWYPLVEAGITRQDCLDWWGEKSYPPLPRSACIGCPYRTDKEWQSLAEPEMTDAIQFDEAIRYKRGNEFPSFLHQQRIPLVDVKFGSNDDHQMSWGEECEGMCGV